MRLQTLQTHALLFGLSFFSYSGVVPCMLMHVQHLQFHKQYSGSLRALDIA